jgi:hypothetical protein
MFAVGVLIKDSCLECQRLSFKAIMLLIIVILGVLVYSNYILKLLSILLNLRE